MQLAGLDLVGGEAAAVDAARVEPDGARPPPRLARPDLILMDLQLPRLNGFAVARFVRQDAELRGVPIIVVSAHDPAKHRALTLAAGCNAYVQKPIDFDSLDDMMLSLLGGDGGR